MIQDEKWVIMPIPILIREVSGCQGGSQGPQVMRLLGCPVEEGGDVAVRTEPWLGSEAGSMAGALMADGLPRDLGV